MFIPEFWCGVVATIAVELASVIILAIVLASEPKKIKKDDVEDEE